MAEADGLTDAEAARRLARDGPNELPGGKRSRRRLLLQIADPLSLILAAAGVASIVVLRRPVDGAIILAIVVLNAAIGLGQHLRAEKALQALAEMTAPTAHVVRSGRQRTLPARDLVAGDRVVLAAGDRVPADARLVEASAFSANEAILTGESLPVDKQATAGDEGLVLAGTSAVRGRAIAVVEATGPRTRLARTAQGLQAPQAIPLERDLARLTIRMGALAVAAALVLVAIGALRSGLHDLGPLLLAGVALAVAAVPESLLPVVTLALALGVRRMARRGTIVRRMRAVEGLGRVGVLCVDKTGTITEGRLRVARAWAPGAREDQLWRTAQLCNDAQGGEGDPLEVALLEAARTAGAPPTPFPRTAEEPFDAATRFMATLHSTPAGPELAVKGAPEAVLPMVPAGPQRDEAHRLAEAWAGEGMRVLALAHAATGNLRHRPLALAGLVGFADTLRPSAQPALEACRAAGIRVVMVTGDHAATARAFAAQAGLGGNVVSSVDLDALPEAERAAALRQADVVARVAAHTKVELVRAHQAEGAVVAMMGDGVNDAPALAQADIGVAVAGERGTDVAREAADLVLTRQDLDALVAAVQEGRSLHAAVRQVVSYLLSGNASEVLVVLAGLFLFPELAVPLAAVQLLWVNLLTDGLPALALAMDPPPADLAGPPSRAGLLRGRVASSAALGLLLATLVTGAALAGRALGWSPGETQATLFCSLVLGHVALALVVLDHPFAALRSRRSLALALAASVAAQALVMLVPVARSALGIAPLPALGWAIAGLVPVVLLAATSGWRGLRRARGRAAPPRRGAPPPPRAA